MGTSTISIIIKPPFLLFPLDFEVASRWLSCVSTVSQESQPDRNQIPRRSMYVCTIHFLMPICVCVIWSKNFHYASLLEQRNQLPPRFRVSVSLGVLSHESTHIRNKPGVAVQQLTYLKKKRFQVLKKLPLQRNNAWSPTWNLWGGNCELCAELPLKNATELNGNLKRLNITFSTYRYSWNLTILSTTFTQKAWPKYFSANMNILLCFLTCLHLLTRVVSGKAGDPCQHKAGAKDWFSSCGENQAFWICILWVLYNTILCGSSLVN